MNLSIVSRSWKFVSALGVGIVLLGSLPAQAASDKSCAQWKQKLAAFTVDLPLLKSDKSFVDGLAATIQSDESGKNANGLAAAVTNLQNITSKYSAVSKKGANTYDTDLNAEITALKALTGGTLTTANYTAAITAAKNLSALTDKDIVIMTNELNTLPGWIKKYCQ
jgi:hypothetical protein